MSRSLIDYARLILNVLNDSDSNSNYHSRLWFRLSLDPGSVPFVDGSLSTNSPTMLGTTTLLVSKVASSAYALLGDRTQFIGAGVVDSRIALVGLTSEAIALFTVSAVVDSGSYFTVTVSPFAGSDDFIDEETIALTLGL